jgi:hypothetical protein
MKRLLAFVAGGLGLGALLRRSRRPAPSPSLADDLRAKLEASKRLDANGHAPADAEEDVDARRANVQERARQAIEELGEP